MTARSIRPLLTATHRYDKSLSTRGRGQGQVIEAPILAYLIETPNGRILYDVGCDYRKIAEPALRARHYDPAVFVWGVPEMHEEQRLGQHLGRLGLTALDIDLIVLGHLHFDHAGGLGDVRGPDVHVQRAELAAAASGADGAVFADELEGAAAWRLFDGPYEVAPGIQALPTPGHTAGHMSLYVESERGHPIILCGDAADLQENLDDEIAPGICWQDRADEAVASIRHLKRMGRESQAQLWPNHDLEFFRSLPSLVELG